MTPEISRSLDELMGASRGTPDGLKRLFDFLEFRRRGPLRGLRGRRSQVAGEDLRSRSNRPPGSAVAAPTPSAAPPRSSSAWPATMRGQLDALDVADRVRGHHPRQAEPTSSTPSAPPRRRRPRRRAQDSGRCSGRAARPAWARPAVAAYLLDPSSSVSIRPSPAAPRIDDDGHGPRQLDFGGTPCRPVLVAQRPAAVALADPVAAARRGRGLTSTSMSSCRSSRCSPGWRPSGVSTAPNSSVSTTALGRGRRAGTSRTPRARRSASYRRHCRSSRAPADAGQEDQSGYDRPAQLEKIRHEHEIVEHLLGLPVEKLPFDLRRVAPAEAADGRIRATFTTVLAPAGSRRSTPTSTTSRSEPRWVAFRKAFVPSDGCNCWSPTTTRSAALYRPPGRDPGLIEAHLGHRRTAGRWASSTSLPTTSTSSNVEGQDGQARLRHGGVRPRPAPRHPGPGGRRDPRRLLRRVPAVRSTWTARSPRPATGATPRRCSAADGRSRSSCRTTPGSGRRGSGRR